MRVLLVEDDELLGSGVCAGLEQYGYRVDWLRDGRLAAAALRDEEPDLLVLDLGLPGMDGLQVLDQLRRRGSTLPVLALTARDTVEDRIVGVTYVAPRAVRTRFNSDAVYRMAKATRMQMDDPGWVADRIIAALEADARDVYLGFPESLFARLNSAMPRLLDSGLRRQSRQMAPFARGA